MNIRHSIFGTQQICKELNICFPNNASFLNQLKHLSGEQSRLLRFGVFSLTAVTQPILSAPSCGFYGFAQNLIQQINLQFHSTFMTTLFCLVQDFDNILKPNISRFQSHLTFKRPPILAFSAIQTSFLINQTSLLLLT